MIEGGSLDASYSWTERSKLFAEPDVVTGRLYGRYGVRESEAHVRCFTQFMGESVVSLSAKPDSSVGRLGFGTSLTGFSSPVWIKHCRVKYKVGYF